MFRNKEGRFVSRREFGRRKKLSKTVKSCDEGPDIEGLRIIDLKVLCQNLKCACGQELKLRHIESEIRVGLGSCFRIRCTSCLLLNLVPTSEKIKEKFIINDRLAIGTLHAGLGYAALTKLLSALNIPTPSWKTYKAHERNVGPAVEKVARESCIEATLDERSLTVANSDEIKNLLPKNLPADFLCPVVPAATRKSVITTDNKANESEFGFSNSTVECFTISNDELKSELLASQDITFDVIVKGRQPKVQENIELLPCWSDSPIDYVMVPDPSITFTSLNKSSTSTNGTVRMMASYDMGWSKRGCGKNYDSLNGYAALIGSQSGKVLDFATRNRKCAMCDKGHPQEDHDCRLNYVGSAKGMEPDAGVSLIVNSEILKDLNTKVGILVGDDDSTTICRARAESEDQIVKFSDGNHTTRGVGNALYEIKAKQKSNAKELTTQGIQYLKRCFSHAVGQNKGHPEEMEKAIRNITAHAYNEHDNCGSWCGYHKNPDTYEHKTVPGGFKNETLRKELDGLFNKLAGNVEKFAAGASSQANESLNGMMARKARKDICYSKSESADFRFAASVAQKNRGEDYLQTWMASMSLTAGRYTEEHMKRTDKQTENKRKRTRLPATKRARLENKKKRDNLRRANETKEGPSYSSHIGLLSQQALLEQKEEETPTALPHIDEDNLAFVYFDLETSSVAMTCDILQIAMRSGSRTFSRYIHPVQAIRPEASEKNGLTNNQGELFFRGVKIDSVPKNVALLEMMNFLTSFKKKIILVAHNAGFDSPRLLKAVREANLLNRFKEIVHGFACTLKMITKKYPERKGPGRRTLSTLAQEILDMPVDNAHNAEYDVLLLEKLAEHEFRPTEIAANIKSLALLINEMEGRKKKSPKAIDVDRTALKERIRSLKKLENITSGSMRIKIAKAGLDFESLLEKFKTDGSEGLAALIKEKATKKKSILKSVLDYFLNVSL